MRVSKLVAIAAIALALQIVATLAAIAINLPTQFDRKGIDAAQEWVARGTAISPPLVPMIIFAISILLALRRSRWGTAGVVLICLLGVVFIIGALGEALAPPTPAVGQVVLVGSGVAGSVMGLLLVGFGIRELRDRRRSGRRGIP